MSETLPDNLKDELPFVMWKMFHSTISAIFKNLDNAENNLRELAKTLVSSKECSDLFIPRYDKALNSEQIQRIEKTYQSFTTWLLGRLFYLLSYEKFERIHDLFIQAQQKILVVLKLSQPHIHLLLIEEYNKSFTILNQHLNSFENQNFEHSLSIHSFITDNITFKDENLELTPIFIEIKNINSCYLLQPKILKLLVEPSLVFTQSSWFDKTAESVLNNIVLCLHNSNAKSKITVVDYLNKLIKHSYFKIEKTFMLYKHFQELFHNLEIFICELKFGSNFNSEEIELFNLVLNNLFDSIFELEIIQNNNFVRQKCKNITNFLILFKLREYNCTKLNLNSIMKLLTTILAHENTLYPEIKFIIHYITSIKNCDNVDVILQYQIFQEIKNDLKNNIVDVYTLSNTWKTLYNDFTDHLNICLNNNVNIDVLFEVLNYLKSISEVAKIVYYKIDEFYNNNSLEGPLQVTLIPIGEIIIKIKRLINIYNINTSSRTQKCLDLIVDALSNIISISYFTQWNSNKFISVIEIISYPLTRKLSDISELITVDFTDKISTDRQIRALKILATCMMSIDAPEKNYYKVIRSDILKNIFNCVTSKNVNIILQVAEEYIYFISTIRGEAEKLSDILKKLLESPNPEVLQKISSNLGKIICVISGDFIITPEIKLNNVFYNLNCLQCDFTRNEENRIKRISDNKIFPASKFICQKNSLNKFRTNLILNLLNSNNVEVKKNIIKQLPRFAKHLTQFNTIQIMKSWLKFMEDENRDVRINFISVIKPLMDTIKSNMNLTEDYKTTTIDTCLTSLKLATQKHIRTGNADLIETLIDTLNEFGCLNYFNVSSTTKIMIAYVLLCNRYLSSNAINHINNIAENHNLTPNVVFHKNKKLFCQFAVHMIVTAYIDFEYNIEQSLERFSLAFGFTLKDFLTRNSHHLVPYFIPLFVRLPDSLKILTDMSNLMVTEPSELIINNFSYIYIHAYLNEDQEIFKKSVKLVEEITTSQLNVLKKRSIKVIHNELLMHFHDKKELVLEELYKLSLEESSTSSFSSSSEKIQQISIYLQPRFLGVLVYFDTKLVSSYVDDSVKIKVLQSLPMIIKLMGSKFITSLRHKVLVTLRTALSLTENKYLELICNNWDAFIHCCEVDSLGPLLSTIFVSILPLLDLFPTKITSIFKYLLIDNNEKLEEYYPELFFLMGTKVDNEIKNIIKNHIVTNQNTTCREKLSDFLRFISHENTEVKVHGLKFLKKYLEEKHSELEDLIVGNNGMDQVLVEIIDVLITGCRENDQQVRLACGQCIGELGAIEPSHFPRKYTSQSDSAFTFYLSDDSFVVNALLELLRSFQMEKHSQNMNRFALAIQEILKAYGVSPDERARKHNLWKMFPENMQELMYPLLSSRYTVAPQSNEKISVHPIFGSHLGATSYDWSNNWSSYLISLLTTDKKNLMQVCKPSFKYDYRTLMIFLPHILIHAILESEENDRKNIFDEIMAVLNFSDGQEKLIVKQMLYQPLKTKQFASNGSVGDSNKNNCIKIVFVLLDYLNRWLREYECQKCPKSSNLLLEKDYKIVYTFLSQFCKLKIAKCNFLRGEYPRALMYLEQYVSNDKNKLNEQLGFFAKIYAELEEPDGVAGAMAMKETDPSIEDMLLAHNVAGHFQDAVTCYERMAQENSLEPQYLQDMVRCYLELDNPLAALSVASTAMEKFADYQLMLNETLAEPYWRMGSFDELTELLKKPEMANNKNWGVRVGQALVHFRNGNRQDFQNEIINDQKMLIEMLSITSLEEGIYRHGYPNIIKLHILNELQKAEEIVHKLKEITDSTLSERIINELVEEWDIRLKVVQSSVRVIEPILRLRRIILEQTQFVLGSQSNKIKVILDKHIAKYWLKSAEIARQSSIFQQAYMYILSAEQYKPKELFIEKAKFYWAKEKHDLAFSTLKRGIEEYFPDAVTFKDMDPSLRKSDRKLCAEAKLLIATYNDETSNVDMEVNMTNYREAADMCREWEKSQVCLGQYYDRIFSTITDEEKDLKGAKMQIHIINSFGKSLQYGSTYIYQSMPRMLSIWFDCGTRIVESMPTDNAKARESKKATLMQMIKLIDTYLDRLPAYMFLSAFSQLVSRICHPVREVYTEIKSIIIKLILKYPQQTLWMLMSVSKSAYAMRTKRCQEVLQDDRIKNSGIMKLVHDFNRLADKLIELCNKPISDGVVVSSVNTLIRTLPRLLQNKEFSQIMIPIEKMRKLVLPNPEYSNSNYNPFPNSMVYIVNIEDEIQILQSLQRPRKITFLGSDGKKYVHMLKPKDDLRKDFRLMEFNDVVNLYLHREAESRQKRLCIRTYSVVPLNEECGIIEWIDNLIGLRPILMKIYKQRGLFMPARELKTLMCHIQDDLSKKRDIFEKKLLPRHPPVLSEWFRRTFPDAHCWYHARSAYVRTSAVVSMVGYILGLGDRHGENILFDSTNGDTVQVDFNCLFNKGETFDWPERVPFRLTQNMVEAMGPLGVEGVFRRTCAVTLKVLRTHIDTLMSIVRPFVYDPLVSWPRNQLLKSDTSEAERTNEKAVEHIRNIELRLQGMIKTRGKAFSNSLSCEGQANYLILEATNIDNLAQMYIGWGPYL